MGRRLTVTFLLDANVLFNFQNGEPDQLHALVRAGNTVALAVAEQVFDEATLPDPNDSTKIKNAKRRALNLLESSAIRRLEILPGSEEAAWMSARLSPIKEVKKKDAGEAASIALARADHDLVFVTSDRTATLWTLNELFNTGERVVRTQVFARTLLEMGAIDSTVVRAIEPQLVKLAALPGWWSSWRADIDSELSAGAIT